MSLIASFFGWYSPVLSRWSRSHRLDLCPLLFSFSVFFFSIAYYKIIISLRKYLRRKEVFNNIFKEMVFSESGEKGSCQGGPAQRSCSHGLEMQILSEQTQLVRQKLQESGGRKTFMGSAKDMELNLRAKGE